MNGDLIVIILGFMMMSMKVGEKGKNSKKITRRARVSQSSSSVANTNKPRFLYQANKERENKL